MRAAIGLAVAATLLLAGVIIAGSDLAPRDPHGAAIAAARELIADYVDRLDDGMSLDGVNAQFDHVEGMWVPGADIVQRVVAVVATTYPGSSMTDLDDPVRVGACLIPAGRMDVPGGCPDAWSAFPHPPDYLVALEDA